MDLAVPAVLMTVCAEDDRRWWLDDVRRLVPELAKRWTLRLGPPMEPGGRSAWVCPAVDGSGREVVLKVGWRHPEAEHEAEGLAVWAGDGVVRVFRAERFEHSLALVVERCRPGMPLTELPEPQQDVVVAGLLRRLWVAPPTSVPFRSLDSMCADWAVEAEQIASRSGGVRDRVLLQDGLALLRALAETAPRSVLLVTDLHAGNVLAAEREPWLVIDPKPHVGDPAFDAVQHLLNCEGRLRADPHGLAQRMGDLLDVEVERLLRWLFARCVQESVNDPRIADVARRIAPG